MPWAQPSNKESGWLGISAFNYSFNTTLKSGDQHFKNRSVQLLLHKMQSIKLEYFMFYKKNYQVIFFVLFKRLSISPTELYSSHPH